MTIYRCDPCGTNHPSMKSLSECCEDQKGPKNKVKCFWCNKLFVDLISHTKNIHPKLTARSYDYNK